MINYYELKYLVTEHFMRIFCKKNIQLDNQQEDVLLSFIMK